MNWQTALGITAGVIVGAAIFYVSAVGPLSYENAVNEPVEACDATPINIDEDV